MKKNIWIGLLSALILVGCTNEESFDSLFGTVKLEASIDNSNSRVAFDENGDFLWTINDAIGVTTTGSKNSFSKMNINEGGIGISKATFTGKYMSGTPEGYAVYPYNKEHKMSGTILTYNFPVSYDYTIEDHDYFVSDGTGNSFNPPMWSAISDGKVHFKHLGGVFCIKIANLPAGQNQQLKLIASNRITGNFTVELSSTSPKLETMASVENNVVTINYSNSVESTRVFYVPVPTGTYESFVVEFEAEGETVSVPFANKEVKPRQLKRLVIGEGSIEGGEANSKEVASIDKIATDNVLNSDKEDLTVKVIGEVSGTDNTITIPAALETETTTFSFANIAQGATIKITEETASSYDGQIIIEVPVGTATNQIEAYVPNGEVYIKQGNVTTLIASSKQNTTIIGSGVTIETLTIKQGNVRIKDGGNVATIQRSEDNADALTYVYFEGAVPAETNSDLKIMYVSNSGSVVVNSVEQFKAALSNNEIITIQLGADLTLNEILVINRDITLEGNDKKLTSSAGRAINVSGADGVTIQNLEIVASGERAINIIQNSTNVTITNVTATSRNYTINVANSAPAAKVSISNSNLTGLNVVNVASQSAEVIVSTSTINCNDNNTTEGEAYAALCLHKDAIGGKITATDCTINVTEGSDSTMGRNGAEDGTVTIDGSTDGVNIDVAAIIYGNYYYGFTSLAKAFEFAENGNKITLIRNFTLEEQTTVPDGKNIILDLNGYTITGTDNATGNFGLITLNPGSNLNIISSNSEGKITLKATNDRKFNSYSSVISNQCAELTVGENVVIEHFGGTDMAYGIDNLTNTGAQHAKTTIDGATVKSTYRAIRQFLNSTAPGVNNELHVKSGIIEAANKSIWMQNANTGANPGKLTVEATAQLKGDVQLSASDAEVWAVEVSIAAKALVEGSEVLPSKVKEGYEVVLNNGNYVVKKVVTRNAATLEELVSALTDAGAAGAGYSTIYITADIDMNGQTWTPIKIDGYHGADIVTVEGNGYTIKGLTAGLFAGGFAGGSGIVIKNLTIEDSKIVANNTLGYGAFVGCADSMDEITLINCHLKNSSIITPNEGANESRIGGLIGWTAGYNVQNDGPVDSYIKIQDCSVIGCTLKGAGSIGGIVGHAGANAATFTTIENCKVSDNIFTSTDDGGWRVGVVVGTANNGQCVINGITSSNNTLTQTGKSAPEGQSDLYGRFVPAGTGTLIIDGKAIE